MRVLVVYKKSAYQIYALERRNKHIKQLILENHSSVRHMAKAHEAHERTMETIKAFLDKKGIQAAYRYRADEKAVGKVSLVITVGGDGTLLSLSHQVDANMPVLAINSAVGNSVGFFAAGDEKTAPKLITQALEKKLKPTMIQRLNVKVNGITVHNRVLNDVLFAHPSPGSVSRYILKPCVLKEKQPIEKHSTKEHRNAEHSADEHLAEEQKSSGIWIAPPAGSTAAIRSAGGKKLSVTAKQFQYVVREPYLTQGQQLEFTQGVLSHRESLLMVSKMRLSKLWIDGNHDQFDLKMGDEVKMSLGNDPLCLLGFKGW